MKNNKGITLIALIVTIIVLIILAGVAIAMLSGDNGVLKNAEAARYDTSISTFDERVKLAQMTVKTTITSKMVQIASNGKGYTAVDTDNYNDLVSRVKSELSAELNSYNKEGYTIYDGIKLETATADTPRTGYMLVTFTDNAFRSSLPVIGPEATEKGLKAGGTFVSGNARVNVESYDPDNAVLAYVIKVTNYSSELSNLILTTEANITAATTKGSEASIYDAFIKSAAGQKLIATPTPEESPTTTP